jgi:hypothetical protein
MKFLSGGFDVLSLFVLGCDDKPGSPAYPDLYLDSFEALAKVRGYDQEDINYLKKGQSRKAKPLA